jgi:hypothetical protein
MDTLAVRLTIPPVGFVGDFHSQVRAPCRAHEKKRPLENERPLVNADDGFKATSHALQSAHSSADNNRNKHTSDRFYERK